tara:strand:+ start:7931 stop:10174 length:2244 start_codon:yes stop_codon:yes gene_type:complete
MAGDTDNTKGAINTGSFGDDPFVQDELVKDFLSSGAGVNDRSLSVVPDNTLAGSITTPFLGTTPIFSGEGIMLQRDKKLTNAARRSVGATKTAKRATDDPWNTAAQFLDKYDKYAATAYDKKVQDVLSRLTDEGLSGGGITAVLGNSLSGPARELENAKRGLTVLGTVLSDVDEKADALEELKTDLNIDFSNDTMELLDGIRRGDQKYLDMAINDELGPTLDLLTKRISMMGILGELKKIIEPNISALDFEKFNIKDLSTESQFIKSVQKSIYTPEKIATYLGQLPAHVKESIKDYGQDEIINVAKSLFDKDLAERYAQIRPKDEFTFNVAEADNTTATMLSIKQEIGNMGLQSKRIEEEVGSAGSIMKGLTKGSVIKNSNGEILINSFGRVVRLSKDGEVLSTTMKDNELGLTTEIINHFKPDYNIGVASNMTADVQEQAHKVGFVKEAKSLLNKNQSPEDVKYMEELSKKVEFTPDGEILKDAKFSDIAEMAIVKGGLIPLGDNVNALGVISHSQTIEEEGTNPVPITGINFEAQNGDVGIMIPKDLIRGKAKREGVTEMLPEFISNWFRDETMVVRGDDGIWVKNGAMWREGEEDGKAVYTLADSDGHAILSDGKTLSFPKNVIEDRARATLKDLNYEIRSASMIREGKSSTVPLDVGKFYFAKTQDIESVIKEEYKELEKLKQYSAPTAEKAGYLDMDVDGKMFKKGKVNLTSWQLDAVVKIIMEDGKLSIEDLDYVLKQQMK